MGKPGVEVVSEFRMLCCGPGAVSISSWVPKGVSNGVCTDCENQMNGGFGSADFMVVV